MTGPYDCPLEFRFAPRPDITPAEREALKPFLGRHTMSAIDYYVMGSEGRHLMVGPAMEELTWSH